ncbi:AI-2E family transporter [Kurthia senegalensis]|uniref:AI-2E family transporter n=1 Tax=Kurthia senegalensis TaxID=1033740 RepID=UPI000289B2F2|nr:AI-2E family transporter [Kurthia senegalensis]
MEEQKKVPTKKESFFSSRFIQFLGGRNTLYSLIVLLLAGLIVAVYDKISFIFDPLVILFSTIVMPILLSGILFYLLRPVLRLLVKWGLPKIAGIILIYLVGIGLITVIITLVFPFIKEQFLDLIKEFPAYMMQLMNTAQDFVKSSFVTSTLDRFGIDLTTVFDNTSKEITTKISEITSSLGTSIANGVGGFVSTLTSLVIAIITTPFILFYLLKDGEKLPHFMMKILPKTMRKETGLLLKRADTQIAGYIQGQIIVSICIGIMITIGFLIIRMDYAVVLGVLAMVTSVVPYLGPMIAITPAAIIALVTSPFMILKLAIVWTVVQFLEGKFISPQVMGKSLHIHPITIIFVLLTAGKLFGVMGVILGIPGYAVVKVFASHIVYLYKRRYNKYQPERQKHFELDEEMEKIHEESK